MFLVGELNNRDTFEWDIEIKKKITKDDLANVKNKSTFQVINLESHQYFDPEENVWKDIKSEAW